MYSGNRGSKVVNVLGTVFMSVLAGHWRYAHVSAIRGDAINPDLLGMTATVSEDVIRDAMKRMPEAEALQWRRELGIRDEQKTILFAGKFERKKQPLELIKAFGESGLNDAVLLMVGDGEFSAEVGALAAEIGRAHV